MVGAKIATPALPSCLTEPSTKRRFENLLINCLYFLSKIGQYLLRSLYCLGAILSNSVSTKESRLLHGASLELAPSVSRIIPESLRKEFKIALYFDLLFNSRLKYFLSIKTDDAALFLILLILRRYLSKIFLRLSSRGSSQHSPNRAFKAVPLNPPTTISRALYCIESIFFFKVFEQSA